MEAKIGQVTPRMTGLTGPEINSSSRAPQDVVRDSSFADLSCSSSPNETACKSPESRASRSLHQSSAHPKEALSVEDQPATNSCFTGLLVPGTAEPVLTHRVQAKRCGRRRAPPELPPTQTAAEHRVPLFCKPTLLAAGWLLFQPRTRLGQQKLALQCGVEGYRLFEVLLRVLAPRFPEGCNHSQQTNLNMRKPQSENNDAEW